MKPWKITIHSSKNFSYADLLCKTTKSKPVHSAIKAIEFLRASKLLKIYSRFNLHFEAIHIANLKAGKAWQKKVFPA